MFPVTRERLSPILLRNSKSWFERENHSKIEKNKKTNDRREVKKLTGITMANRNNNNTFIHISNGKLKV